MLTFAQDLAHSGTRLAGQRDLETRGALRTALLAQLYCQASDLEARDLTRELRAERVRHQCLRNLGALGRDAIGGGGWGSIVLSSLIAGGRHPRFSLGTVKATRFFIAMLSSLTFVTVLSHVHWDAVLGLVIGSAIASPIAAKVSNKISAKTIMIAVAVIVILVSMKSIYTFLLKIA